MAGLWGEKSNFINKALKHWSGVCILIKHFQVLGRTTKTYRRSIGTALGWSYQTTFDISEAFTWYWIALHHGIGRLHSMGRLHGIGWGAWQHLHGSRSGLSSSASSSASALHREELKHQTFGIFCIALDFTAFSSGKGSKIFMGNNGTFSIPFFFHSLI